MIIGKSLLKHKEGEPDVVGSFSMNRDENLTVVANRKNISDKEDVYKRQDLFPICHPKRKTDSSNR